MTSMSSRERKLFEEPLKTLLVLRRVTVSLAPDTFQIEVGDQAWCTVTRARDDKGIQIVLLDHAVEVDVSALVRSCLRVPLDKMTYVKD
jgi:hypothetical protein